MILNLVCRNNIFGNVIRLSSALIFVAIITGCASVPMGDIAEDARLKSFPRPPEGTAGLYIFRDSSFGAALKKTVMIDGSPIGQSAPMSYFYTTVEPGQHLISTESEFGDNGLDLITESGKNYYINQYIKFGVMVGGANVKLVDEAKGQKGVLACELAATIYGYEPYTGSVNASPQSPLIETRAAASDIAPLSKDSLDPPEEVLQAAESMMCSDNVTFGRSDGEKKYWEMRCADGESLELLCIEGTCYVR